MAVLFRKNAFNEICWFAWLIIDWSPKNSINWYDSTLISILMCIHRIDWLIFIWRRDNWMKQGFHNSKARQGRQQILSNGIRAQKMVCSFDTLILAIRKRPSSLGPRDRRRGARLDLLHRRFLSLSLSPTLRLSCAASSANLGRARFQVSLLLMSHSPSLSCSLALSRRFLVVETSSFLRAAPSF